MSTPCTHYPVARFGVFELDLREGELRRSGLRLKLAPQPFQVLQALLERPGEIVTRDELRDRVWPESTFIDYRLALKKCVNRIREALGDSVDHPRFIETLRGRGYRFVAPVEWTGGFSVQPVEPASNGTTAPTQSESPNRRFWQIGAVCLVVLVGSGALFRTGRLYRSADSRPRPEPVVLPLISLPGQQSMPAFSPDGSRVAFLWRAPKHEESGIYVSVVGTQSVLRLSQGANDYSPAWSPDGREVAFLRDEGDQFFVRLAPALGGSERRIYAGVRGPFNTEYETANYGLSFSTDGKQLAFSDWNTIRQEGAIKLLALQDSSARFVTSPPAGFRDRRPAFSPDGSEIAFVRSTGPTEVDELYVLSLAKGRLRKMTSSNKSIFGSPTWGSAGQGDLLFVWSRRSGGDLAYSGRGGVPQPVPGAGPVARHPSASPSGGELAYEHLDERENLWRLELKDAIHAAAGRRS